MRFTLVRKVKTPLTVITQWIPIDAKDYEEALKKAKVLNDPKNLNPKAKIIDWHLEAD